MLTFYNIYSVSVSSDFPLCHSPTKHLLLAIYSWTESCFKGRYSSVCLNMRELLNLPELLLPENFTQFSEFFTTTLMTIVRKDDDLSKDIFWIEDVWTCDFYCPEYPLFTTSSGEFRICQNITLKKFSSWDILYDRIIIRCVIWELSFYDVIHILEWKFFFLDFHRTTFLHIIP